MEKLRIIDNLCHIEEKNNYTLKGDLICSCGSDFFSVFYFGKQTRGILAPDLVRKKGTLFVEGRCSICGDKIAIYDSETMGSPKRRSKQNLSDCVERPLIRFGIRPYKIKVLFNYWPNNMRSVDFEDIFIEVRESTEGEWKRIVEE